MNVRAVNRLTTKSHEEEEVNNKESEHDFHERSVNSRTETGESRESKENKKRREHSNNTESFVRNRTENSIERKEVSLRNNVVWGDKRVGRNVVIRVTHSVRHEENEEGNEDEESEETNKVFRSEVRVETEAITHNGKRVSRTVLVKSEKVNSSKSSENERKEEVKREETIKSSIVNTVTTSNEVDKVLTDKWNNGEEISNDSSTSVRHLSSWKDITKESGSHHNNINNDTNRSEKSTRRTVRTVVDTTTDVKVDENEEERSTVSVEVTDNSTVVNITHNVLDTSESKSSVWSVMHSKSNTSDNLDNKSKTKERASVSKVGDVSRERRVNDEIVGDR